MSDLIRREDAYAAIRGLTRHIDRIAAITALPAVQPDAREAAIREADPVNRPMMTDLMVDPEEVPDMEMEYDHRAGD